MNRFLFEVMNEQDNNRRVSTIEEIAMMLTDLRGCRKNAGITLREVEKKTGISNAYLSQLETGKITNPSYKEVVLPLYQLYFNVQHARVVLHEQYNKPERTAMQELIDFAQTKIYNTDGPTLIINKAIELRDTVEKEQLIDFGKEAIKEYYKNILPKEPIFSKRLEGFEDASRKAYNQKYPNHGK